MSDFILSATSTVDISREELEKENIKWISFPYQIDGKEYMDDLGKTLSLDDFYQAMIDGAVATTSQITYVRYINYFEDLLKEGKDILHMCLSSGITGEYQQALMAKKELETKYPERKILILDSLTATACQGILLLALNEQRNEGKTIDEVYDWATKNRANVNALFFTSDLTYLVRGGRLSKAAGSFGNLLNICPIIEVNLEGKLIVRDKIRTKKKAMKSLAKQISKRLIKDFPYLNEIFIVHTHSKEDAEELKSMLNELLPDYTGNISIHEIGTTVGAHLGPGTVGAGFWGEEKTI